VCHTDAVTMGGACPFQHYYGPGATQRWAAMILSNSTMGRLGALQRRAQPNGQQVLAQSTTDQARGAKDWFVIRAGRCGIGEHRSRLTAEDARRD